MRYIDAFNHFYPERFFAKILQTPSGAKDVVNITAEIPIIHDLQARLRLVERFQDYSQILSLPLPPIETLVEPDQSPELARIGNDGMAELVMKYPDHFTGYVASLPMNVPDAAAREAERALANGANGQCSRWQRSSIGQLCFIRWAFQTRQTIPPKAARNMRFGTSWVGPIKRALRWHAWFFRESWIALRSSRSSCRIRTVCAS